MRVVLSVIYRFHFLAQVAGASPFTLKDVLDIAVGCGASLFTTGSEPRLLFQVVCAGNSGRLLLKDSALLQAGKRVFEC